MVVCRLHRTIFQGLDMAGVALVESLPKPMVTDEFCLRDNPPSKCPWHCLVDSWDQSKLRGKGLLLTPHSLLSFVLSGRLHRARARVAESILLTHSKGVF